MLVEIEPERYRLAVELGARGARPRRGRSGRRARPALRAARAASPGSSPPRRSTPGARACARGRGRRRSRASRARPGRAQPARRATCARRSPARSRRARVQTGQYVQPGTVLATLVRRDPLLLRFEVPGAGRRAPRSRGMRGALQRAAASDDASTPRDHPRRRRRPTPRSRMVAVTAHVDDPARGSAAARRRSPRCACPSARIAGAPVIPQTAIRPSERGFLAFVVEDGVARERVLDARPAHRRRPGRGARGPGRRRARSSCAAPRRCATGARVRVDDRRAPRPRPSKRAVKLTEVCIQKPVLAWMLMAATVVFGVVAATRIGISQFPDVDFPTISVGVDWEGAAPEVDRERRRRAARGGAGAGRGRALDHLDARARAAASITVELDLARDVDLALQDVQAKVAQAQRRLPRDIEPPVISKTNPEDQPIMWVGLSGPVPAPGARRLRALPRQGAAADRARRRRDHDGRLPRAQRAHLGRRRPRSTSAASPSTDVTDGAAARARRAAGGAHRDRRARGQRARARRGARPRRRCARIVVGERGGSAGATSRTWRSSRTASRTCAALLARQRRAGAGPRHPQAARRQRRRGRATACAPAIDEIREDAARRAWSSASTSTRRSFIEESVHEIEFELVLAVLLTALVCWLFLGSLSSTLNVVLAIPMSLLGTVAVIYFLGFTLNTFTLLGAGARRRHRRRRRDHGAGEHLPPRRDRARTASRAAREGTARDHLRRARRDARGRRHLPPGRLHEGRRSASSSCSSASRSASRCCSRTSRRSRSRRRAARRSSTSSREGRSRVGPRRRPRLRRAWRAATPALLRLGAAPPGRSCSPAAACSFAAAIVVFRALPQRVRAVAGPEPRSWSACRPRSARTSPRPTALFRRAEEFVARAARGAARCFAVVGGFGGGGRQHRHHLRHARAAAASATLSQARVRGGRAARSSTRSPACAPSCRTSRSRASPRSAASRSSSRCAARTGTQLVAIEPERDARARGRAGSSSTSTRDYQLGMPELRVVPDRARARRPRRPDRGRRHDAQRARRRRARRQVQRRAAGASTSALRLLADQRSRPGGPRAPAGAHGDGRARAALVAGHDRGAAGAAGDHAPRPRARHHRLRQRRAGHSQDEALAEVERARQGAARSARASCSAARASPSASRCGSLLFALVLGIVVAYMVLASQFNSFLHPVTVLTILPLSLAGAAARSVARRARASTSSA